MLRRMDEQLLDLISLDDDTNASLLVVTPEPDREVPVEEGRSRIAYKYGSSAEVALRRRSTFDLAAEFSDNDDEDDLEVNLEDDSHKRENNSKQVPPHMLLGYTSIVDERGNPENIPASSSYVPLKTVFSDELSLSSLGSHLEGSDSLSLSSVAAKYNCATEATSDTSNTDTSSRDDSAWLAHKGGTHNSHGSNKSSTMLIHDAVDAIREEASKMEAAFAIDKLQTMESELNSIKKLLHAQTDQIEHLKKEVRSKDEALAMMQLERDLVQADMEAYEVSKRAEAAWKTKLVSSSPTSLTSTGTHGPIQTSPPTLAEDTCNKKSPPIFPEGTCIKNSPVKLREIRNKSLGESMDKSLEELSSKEIGFVSKGSAFSPASKILDKHRGRGKSLCLKPQDTDSHDSSRGHSRGSSKGSSKGSSQGSSKENRSVLNKKPSTDSQFKPICPSVPLLRQQKESSTMPVKTVAPAAMAPTKISSSWPPRDTTASTSSVKNSILANTTSQNSILANSTTSSSSSSFTERMDNTTNSFDSQNGNRKGAKTEDLNSSIHSLASRGSTTQSVKSNDHTKQAAWNRKIAPDATTFESNLGVLKEESEPNQTRICGASLFRRRKLQHKDVTTKRQTRLLVSDDRKKKVGDGSQSLQSQVEELAQRLRSSVEGSEDLRKRLAMISRYYETTVHSLHENIVSLKKEQTSMQVDLTKQIKRIDRERLVAIKRTHLLMKEQEIARFKKH